MTFNIANRDTMVFKKCMTGKNTNCHEILRNVSSALTARNDVMQRKIIFSSTSTTAIVISC